jgi:hypothetical protein
MYEFNTSLRHMWTPDFKLYDYGCIYCVSKFDIMFFITINACRKQIIPQYVNETKNVCATKLNLMMRSHHNVTLQIIFTYRGTDSVGLKPFPP